MIRLDRDATNRQLLDFEEVCSQFERTWRPESAVASIEDCLELVPESQQSHLVEELIAIECELLMAHGQVPDRSLYEGRFAKWQEAVVAAFDSHVCTDRELDSTNPTRPERLGDYRLVREIGRGGMGIVYEAIQESLGRRVAIKTHASTRLFNPEHFRRFEREARAVASLHHTNIVEIHGTGEQNGFCYYAMQLVDGKSLSRVITETLVARRREPSANECRDKSDLMSGPSSHRQIAEIGTQIARALSYAHGRGVLHRDVKPANLLLDNEGTVWLTDFGLAMLCDEEDITRTGDVIGTLRYLPPEALRGAWDERGDVYGLGLTLYELLALQPAFDETDRLSLLDQIVRGDRPPSPRTLNHEISRDLETIVMKAISLEPSDRYRSAEALADDLQRFIDGDPIKARRASAPERLWKWSRRKPALATLVAVVMLVAIVGFPTVALLWRSAKSSLAMAVSERATSHSARIEAESARDNANAARNAAESAREEAEAISYANAMQLTQNLIEQAMPAQAEATLLAWAPPDRRGSGSEPNTMIAGRSATFKRDQRGWEWNYLWQQLDSSLMTLRGHSGAVTCVAIRPGDSQIATVGGFKNSKHSDLVSGEVILWDAVTGDQLNVLRSQSSGFTGAAYSPDGKRLATIGPKRTAQDARLSWIVSLWDPDRGELLAETERWTWRDEIVGSRNKLNFPCVQFSTDGQWLMSSPGPVHIHNAKTLRRKWQKPGRLATMLPDGHLARAGEGRRLYVNELATGRETLVGEELPKGMLDLHVTPDQRHLVSMEDGESLRLWDLPSLDHSRRLWTPGIHWGTLSPRGDVLVFGDRRGAIHFQSLDNGKPRQSRLGHRQPIIHGAFTHDGTRLVTGSADCTVRVWSTSSTSTTRTFETGVVGAEMGAIGFNKDATRVIYASSRWRKEEETSASGWLSMNDDSQTWKRLDATYCTHWPRTDFALSRDGRFLAAPSIEAERPENDVAYSNSGKVSIWSTDGFELMQTIEIGPRAITCIAWNADATLLAIASYGKRRSEVTVFTVVGAFRDAVDSQPKTFSVDDNTITSMNFHSSSLALSTENGIRVLNVGHAGSSSGREPKSTMPSATVFIPHTSESAVSMEYSPDGDRLALAFRNEQRVRVYLMRSPETKLLCDIRAPRQVASVCFSPNGRRLAMVGYDSHVYVCDALTGNHLITLDGSDGQVGNAGFSPRVVFSPDGRLIATNARLGRITIWEADPMNIEVDTR